MFIHLHFAPELVARVLLLSTGVGFHQGNVFADHFVSQNFARFLRLPYVVASHLERVDDSAVFRMSNPLDDGMYVSKLYQNNVGCGEHTFTHVILVYGAVNVFTYYFTADMIWLDIDLASYVFPSNLYCLWSMYRQVFQVTCKIVVIMTVSFIALRSICFTTNRRSICFTTNRRRGTTPIWLEVRGFRS